MSSFATKSARMPHHTTWSRILGRAKENEIVAAPALLRHLDMTSVLLTGDAMFTQRAFFDEMRCNPILPSSQPAAPSSRG